LNEALQKQAADVNACVDVNFIGKIPRKSVPDLVSRSSIFVLPSVSEGLPDTILIAMVCGTPVLATRIPGVQQVIDEDRTGILVNPCSHMELATALAHMLDEPCKSKRLGLRARVVAEGKYLRPILTEKLISVYRQVIYGSYRSK
jgi:glycosyltransferase involved in cell wall biosynthesis